MPIHGGGASLLAASGAEVDTGTDATKYVTAQAMEGSKYFHVKNTISCASNPSFPAGNPGDAYVVIEAGKIGGASGIPVVLNDLAVCIEANDGGTAAMVASSWMILHQALSQAVIGPASATDSHLAVFDGVTGKLVKDGGAVPTTPVAHAQVIFSIEGANLVTTETKPLMIRVPYVGAGATIEEIYCQLGTTPSSANLRITILNNGSNILSGTNYIEIATGATTASRTTNFTSTALAKDDYLQFGISQGDAGAKDLTVHIRYKWTLTGV